MSPETERVIEELDAALFSSDTFHSTEAVTYLRKHLMRWEAKINEIATILDS